MIPAMRCVQRRNGSFAPSNVASHESGNFNANPVIAKMIKLPASTKCCQRCVRLMRTIGRMLERIRAAVAIEPIHHETTRIPVTISIGVAQLGDGETPSQLYERADRLLYKSKLGGRNRVS